MISQHRTFLDNFFESQIEHMNGDILDIGGKKSNKRGLFRPPLSKVRSWRYVNIDASSNPDYLCNAEKIPLPNSSIDGFILSEVLEHVENPEEIIKEALRVLKHGGIGWITMPFLFPIHADPHDFQRWTEEKIRRVFNKYGVNSIEITPVGGIISVVHDLWYATLAKSQRKGSLLNRLFIKLHNHKML